MRGGDLRQWLREETGALHDRLDDGLSRLDLATREGLGDFLLSHAYGLRAAQEAARHFAARQLAVSITDYLALGRADLRALDRREGRVSERGLSEMQQPEHGWAGAGASYVLLGSRLGMGVLRQRFYWRGDALPHSAYMEDRSESRAWAGLLDWLAGQDADSAARSTSSVESLCEMAARQLRGLTGFDRVMVYRFDETGAGEVVAEARAEGIDSFLGLHFPASDIPQQARRLYTQNLLRIIADVDAASVPIYPAINLHGEALDLSQSGIRSASPIHLEYLRNMGVCASMSVSILRDDALWGLFACHHHAPRALPYTTRTAAELFGEFFSSTLSDLETRRALSLRDTSVRLHDSLIAQVASGIDLLENFETFAALIREAIPCDGVVAYIGGEFRGHGITPAYDDFVEIARFLNTAGNGACWHTQHLAATFPQAATYQERCSGLLAVPVSRMPRDYIVLFRREFAQVVHWAGDPSAPKPVSPLGDRLTPRKSFARWQEERRGQCRAWSKEDRAMAEGLRVSLLEVILQLVDSAARERAILSRTQQDLIAELNHRVRNSLNLMAALVNQPRGELDQQEFRRSLSARIKVLSRAHDLVNASSWEPYPLVPLIRELAEGAACHPAAELAIHGACAQIRPSAFTTIVMVLHELISQSRALGSPDGKASLTLARDEHGDLAIHWHEEGADCAEPWRDAFAMAIVERTIPHELNGQSSLHFGNGGMEARLVIPARCAVFHQEVFHQEAAPVSGSGPAAADSSPAIPAQPEPPPPEDEDALLEGRVLLVEDNVLIGMEAEYQLQDLGAQEIDMAGNVAAALDLINTHDYSFAVLDINLGNETSQKVAEALSQRGVRYVFTTGYGEVPWTQASDFGAPVVTKPLDAVALERAILETKRKG